MDKNNVIELERRVIGADPLTELLKEGARNLLAQAVESEVQDLLAQYQDCRTECGHAGVVRNGYLPIVFLALCTHPTRKFDVLLGH